MKFSFYTLGCKVNQYETQAMEQLLIARGHTIGKWEDPCDGYIINTCSVTAVADKKNRAVIRRCRRENPNAIIAVCGCHAQHDPDAIKALGVDLVAGSAHRTEFIDALLTRAMPSPGGKVPPKGADEECGQNFSASVPPSDLHPCHTSRRSSFVSPGGLPPSPREKVFSDDPQATDLLDNALSRRDFEVLPPGGLSGRTRAMLKVQDGCVNFCTYCIIPYTRGPVRSAPLDTAVQQAKLLADQGYREIVLTGIEIASWGVDLPGKPGLASLIENICRAVPHLRVRLGSLEPRIVTEDFCQRLKRLPNLCPHFHLSMQSGCDEVLARMKRKYSAARYYESVALLNEYFPGCAVTTDMIVAFPGETEAEFLKSLAFIQKCGFADMHIFPYSRRPGTPADKMPGQHNNATKEARSRAAIAVAQQMSESYRKNLIGTHTQVLFEEMSDGLWTGHTGSYVKVYAEGENLHNKECTVTLTELYKDGILGEVHNA